MRIALMGKGGSGKTSISTAITSYLKNHYRHVLAIDADVNEHFGQALGFSKYPHPIGTAYDQLFLYLFSERANKNLLPKIGTIPPSNDSQFIYLNERDPFLQEFTVKNDNVLLLNAGKYEENEIGVTCFHGHIYPLELLLHYLIDAPEDAIVIDANAGVDSVSTSMHFAADFYFFVVEPTLKSIEVYLAYRELVKELVDRGDIQLKVIVNKVVTEEDVRFIKKHIPNDELLVVFPKSKDLKQFEQGELEALERFIDTQKTQLHTIHQFTKGFTRNYKAYLHNLCRVYQKQMNGFIGTYYNGNIDTAFNNDFSYEPLISHQPNSYFNTCYMEPLTPYRKAALQFLHNNVNGNVLEVGSGQNPWYWALAYSGNASNIEFTEYSRELIHNYYAFIDTLNITDLETKLSDTRMFLESQKITTLPIKSLFEDILVKSTFAPYNFFDPPKHTNCFNTIIGMESIEIVNTTNELETVLQNIYSLLCNGGKFVGTTFPYVNKDERVQNLIRLNLEGRLNPAEQEIKDAATKAGFSSINLERKSVGVNPYPDAIFIILYK